MNILETVGFCGRFGGFIVDFRDGTGDVGGDVLAALAVDGQTGRGD